jgi:hypothetical protein
VGESRGRDRSGTRQVEAVCRGEYREEDVAHQLLALVELERDLRIVAGGPQGEGGGIASTGDLWIFAGVVGSHLKELCAVICRIWEIESIIGGAGQIARLDTNKFPIAKLLSLSLNDAKTLCLKSECGQF